MVKAVTAQSKGVLLVLIANLIWGTSAFLVRFFPNLGTIEILWSRCLFGMLFMLPMIVIKWRSLKVLCDLKGQAFLLGVNGLLFIGTVGCMTAGVKYGSVSATIFLLYTAPLFIAGLSRIIVGERIGEKEMLPLFFASVALVFIFSGSLGKEVLLGDIFGLLSGICWGLQIMITRRLGKSFAGEISSFWSITIAMVALTPFVNYQQLGSGNLLLLVIYGVLHNGIAATAFAEGLRSISASKAGLLSLIDPIENTLLAAIILRETPTLGVCIGGVLLLMAIGSQAAERSKA